MKSTDNNSDPRQLLDEVFSNFEEKFKGEGHRIGMADDMVLAASKFEVAKQLQAEIKVLDEIILITSRMGEKVGVSKKNLRGGHVMKRAELLTRLSNLYAELFLTIERGRMNHLVQGHEELHPPNKEVCTVCLEEIPITGLASVQYFLCCGNFICFQCLQSSVVGGRMRMKKCPYCREDILAHDMFINSEKGVSQIEVQAEKGRPWAQAQMGIYFLEGSSCNHGDVVKHEVNVKEALKWFKLATEQKQPDAIRIMGQIHSGLYDEVKEVDQCQIKARELMKESADLGNLRAQRNYAMMCRIGQGGPIDKVEAVHYYTLAYSQKGLLFEKDRIAPLNLSDDLPEEVLHAGLFLGIYHYYGIGGLTKNLYIAKHYLEEHVKESEKQCLDAVPKAYMYLAACLMELQESKYGRNAFDFSIPGHSSVPRAMALYRQAIKLGIDQQNYHSQFSKETVAQMVSGLKNCCGNCGVAPEDIPEGKLKECGRCHSAWYCGKDCQAEHWRAGHKSDCVKQQV